MQLTAANPPLAPYLPIHHQLIEIWQDLLGRKDVAITDDHGMFAVATIGYAPFFVALGFGDLIGVALLWTLVRPAQINRRADANLPSPAGA